ncbi:MAG: hypothetical protein ABFE02_13760 [Sulfuricella sp.]
MSNFLTRFRNMLNAIAYAEAGDLDAVKQILQTQYNHSAVAEDKAGEEISDGQSALPAM